MTAKMALISLSFRLLKLSIDSNDLEGIRQHGKALADNAEALRLEASGKLAQQLQRASLARGTKVRTQTRSFFHPTFPAQQFFKFINDFWLERCSLYFFVHGLFWQM